MKTLLEIQEYLKSILPQGIDLTIEAAKAQLVEGTDKFNDIILLEGRYREVGRQLLQGVVGNDEAQVEFNKIRKDLLEFIDTLQDTHLCNTTPDPDDGRPDIYNGEVFYRIPKKMQLEQEVKCIVRLAFDRKVLVEDLVVEETDVLKDLRISDVMGVELLDAHGDSFAIRTLNDTVQFVDKDLYTEWLFFVKPTAAGTHPLTLKISIIEIRNGVERKRNVVLEEQVIVVTVPVEEEAGEMASAGVAMQMGNPMPPKPSGGTKGSIQPPSPPISPQPSTVVSPAPSPVPGGGAASGGRSFRKIAPVLAGVLAMVIASWAAFQGGLFDSPDGPNPGTEPPISVVVPPDHAKVDEVPAEKITEEEYFQIAALENTREAYEDYVEYAPAGKFRDMAMLRLDSIETAYYQLAYEDAAAMAMYIEEYPDGKYLGEARARLKELEAIAAGQDRPTQIRPAAPDRERELTPNEKAAQREKERDRRIAEKERNAGAKPTEDKPETTQPETGIKERPISLKRAARKPIYPGCKNDKKRSREESCTEDRIRRFLSDRLEYPAEAKRKRIEGTVMVLFVVEKDGRVTEVKALEGPGGGTEEEAIRLVKSLPKFEPGQDRSGRPARVAYRLPITFKLRG